MECDVVILKDGSFAIKLFLKSFLLKLHFSAYIYLEDIADCHSLFTLSNVPTYGEILSQLILSAILICTLTRTTFSRLVLAAIY